MPTGVYAGGARESLKLVKTYVQERAMGRGPGAGFVALAG
jgi:hypothetical protein